jgi:hypothetical protein
VIKGRHSAPLPRVPFQRAQLEGDIDNHVLLATNHATPSGLFEKRARVYTVTSGGGFGVTQEARVHPGVAERQGFAVDPHRTAEPTTHQGISIWGHTPEGQRIIDKLAQFKTAGQSLLRREDIVPALSGAG